MLFLPVWFLSKMKTQWFCRGRTDGVVLPPCAVMRDQESGIPRKEKVQQCILESKTFPADFGIGIKTSVFSTLPTPLLVSKNLYKHFSIICLSPVACRLLAEIPHDLVFLYNFKSVIYTIGQYSHAHIFIIYIKLSI